MTTQTKPRPYPRAIVRNVDGGHSIRLSHNPDYYFDVANVYPTYDQALADAAAWVRVERAKDKAPQPVAGPAVTPPESNPAEKVDRRKLRQRKPIPEKCPKCQRPIRRPNDKVADYPGTVPMAIKDGTCQRCHKNPKAASIPRTAPASEPTTPTPPGDAIPISGPPKPSALAGRASVKVTGQVSQIIPVVTIQGSGPLAVPGPSDPVERDRASLDAYLKRRGRDGAEIATLREGRGPAIKKAGF